MKHRTSHHIINTKLSKSHASFDSTHFECLNGQDVIAAAISDHHPVIHDGILFWNIMMQGKARFNEKTNTLRYNNGFGIIEKDDQYLARLSKVATVIAEIVRRFDIEIIGLCEGPIVTDHVNHFYQTISNHSVMEKFLDEKGFKKANSRGDAWGLLMLADSKYHAHPIDKPIYLEPLQNRFQLWKLEHHQTQKYFALAHLPFGGAGDEQASQVSQLSSVGLTYRQMMQQLKDEYDAKNEHLIISADYNFNPILIDPWEKSRGYQVPAHNSILLQSQSGKNEVKTVMVDGILLSNLAMQKLFSSHQSPGFFNRIKDEYSLNQDFHRDYLIENRHQDKHLQKAYDEKFGLVLRLQK